MVRRRPTPRLRHRHLPDRHRRPHRPQRPNHPHLRQPRHHHQPTTPPQLRPLSISPDGTQIAVNQRTGDQTDGDIARDLTANTTIDTHTGANITLPVTGTITAIHYQPDSSILVRTRTGNTHHLTLLNPDHTTRTRVTEPTTTKNLHLLTHTPTNPNRHRDA
ncbi:hypothetical protein GCM10027615_29100 [Plantactinospora veratri]